MRLTLLSTFALSCLLSMAQITTPQPSPLGELEQMVGLTEIEIEYSRPGVKDRKIFGELVPFDQMWRTGANASTKIEFSTDVTINGENVPAGEYALYTIPGKTEWTIILHKNLEYWGTGGDDYDKSEDQIRFKVKSNSAYPVKIETFTINIADVSDNGCNIELLWENTQVKFAVGVSYDEVVMKQIEAAMSISPRTYYAAARYYLEHDKDLTQALEWINKAVEGDETYWIVRQKALILAKLGKYDEAIKAAERSKALAQEAKNDHYIKINDESIAEWKKM
ncbi:DUF2911 domain-containing protein [bacterium]|nr:DUF2911 domain-containing protein [bacterium]